MVPFGSLDIIKSLSSNRNLKERKESKSQFLFGFLAKDFWGIKNGEIVPYIDQEVNRRKEKEILRDMHEEDEHSKKSLPKIETA